MAAVGISFFFLEPERTICGSEDEGISQSIYLNWLGELDVDYLPIRLSMHTHQPLC